MDARMHHAGVDTVVLLHASTSSSRQWDALASDLHASKTRVVAVDVHGHGGAPGWRHPRRPLMLADEVARVVEAVGACQNVHVVGHSYGGAVGVKLATMYPDLVASVVVYEPVLFQLLAAARRDDALEQVLATAMLVGESVMREQPLLAAQRFIEFWSGEAAWTAMPDARRLSIARRMAAVTLHYDAVLAETLDAAALSRIDAPMLFLTGSRTIAPMHELAAIFRAAVPWGEHRMLEGLGHMGPVTDPTVVNAVVRRFLARAGAGAADVGIDPSIEPAYRAAA
jgi:pimeloyl-ACP methyl ester carboxylesterase